MMVGVFLLNISPRESTAQENSPLFLIELNELGISPTDARTLTLPSGDVRRISIHILRPEADNIEYSQIFPSLNGAAAARVSEFRPSERGKLVRIHLKTRPGFELLPGPNVLEVLAINSKGHQFRRSFALNTPVGACLGGGQAKFLTFDDIATLLRAGVTDTRLVKLVGDCGVDFQLTQDTTGTLLKAGATEQLISTIRYPSAARSGEIESRRLRAGEIIDLLHGGVSNERIVELIKEKGVTFSLNEEIEQRLREGGARDNLLRAIKAMAETPATH